MHVQLVQFVTFPHKLRGDCVYVKWSRTEELDLWNLRFPVCPFISTVCPGWDYMRLYTVGCLLSLCHQYCLSTSCEPLLRKSLLRSSNVFNMVVCVFMKQWSSQWYYWAWAGEQCPNKLLYPVNTQNHNYFMVGLCLSGWEKSVQWSFLNIIFRWLSLFGTALW